MKEARNYPLPENYDPEFGETSFSNPGFKDYDALRLTDYNSNLSTDYTFKTSVRPRPETIELVENEFTYAGNEGKLKNALEGSGWAYTNTGLTKLSSRLHLEGNKLLYKPYQWEINALTDKQKEKNGEKK